MTDKSSNAISIALVAAARKEIMFVNIALTRIILRYRLISVYCMIVLLLLLLTKMGADLSCLVYLQHNPSSSLSMNNDPCGGQATAYLMLRPFMEVRVLDWIVSGKTGRPATHMWLEFIQFFIHIHVGIEYRGIRKAVDCLADICLNNDWAYNGQRVCHLQDFGHLCFRIAGCSDSFWLETWNFCICLPFFIGCATLQLLWRQSRQGPGDGMDPRAGWISIVSSTKVSTCLKINPQWKLWCIDFG